MKLHFNDVDQHIDGFGAPDLRLHRVFAGAQKTLDAQELPDPFEEQLHLPAPFAALKKIRQNDADWFKGVFLVCLSGYQSRYAQFQTHIKSRVDAQTQHPGCR